MVEFPIRRILLWEGLVFLVAIPLLLFAGAGYFVLVLMLNHVIGRTAIYSDRILIALLGRRCYSANADAIARAKASKINKVSIILSNIISLAFAFYIIFEANFKLISF
jgi:hypothetical protein